ncbi:hypothetical protein EDC01DRAFT_670638 [Geopyxis carbonaria]|nr:hypothetical protein EDC01DRAFT_670638 [Geopyxis carbonaria]
MCGTIAVDPWPRAAVLRPADNSDPAATRVELPSLEYKLIQVRAAIQAPTARQSRRHTIAGDQAPYSNVRSANAPPRSIAPSSVDQHQMYPPLLLLALLCAPRSAAHLSFVGCYTHYAPLAFAANSTFMSHGLCRAHCRRRIPPRDTIALTEGRTCLCAALAPANERFRVADAACDLACPGYASNTCGGRGGFYYAVLTEVAGEQLEQLQSRVHAAQGAGAMLAAGAGGGSGL